MSKKTELSEIISTAERDDLGEVASFAFDWDESDYSAIKAGLYKAGEVGLDWSITDFLHEYLRKTIITEQQLDSLRMALKFVVENKRQYGSNNDNAL